MNKLIVNKQYKDRLFKWIFMKNKKQLLALYNALSGHNYTDESLLEINTLEDVLYIGMKNDLSFMISSELVLFEQQSTFNPNMPIRELLYCATIYDQYIIVRKMNRFGSKLIKLPTPRCYVFYNGDQKSYKDRYGNTVEISETIDLKLSDAFEVPIDGYEWTVTMINLNEGFSNILKSQCTLLKGYSEFISELKNNRKTHSLEDAVNVTVEQFAEVENDFGLLLKEAKAEVTRMLLTEFNEVEWENAIREESLEEGRKETIEHMILKLHKKGKSEDEISDLLDLELPYVQEVIQNSLVFS